MPSEGARLVCRMESEYKSRALKVELAHTIPHDSFVCCVRFSPDGRYLATGCNKLAQIFDAHTGAKVFTYPHAKQLDLGDMYIRTLCFSPNGKYLVTGSEDNLIRIWDISAQRIVDTLHGHTADIFALAFSPDGCTLVSCAGDGTTRIWDVPRPATSRCTHVLATSARGEGEAGAMCVALAPDGALLAVGSNDGSVQVWDVAGGTLLLRIVGHAKGVYGVAFARDGSGLVTASLDRTLRRWSIDSGGGYRCEMVCEGHKDYVVAVGISPDERWIVSSSKDNSVRFWDLHTGDVQLELTGHKNSVISLDMSPVGGMLASGSGDCQGGGYGGIVIRATRDV